MEKASKRGMNWFKLRKMIRLLGEEERRPAVPNKDALLRYIGRAMVNVSDAHRLIDVKAHDDQYMHGLHDPEVKDMTGQRLAIAMIRLLEMAEYSGIDLGRECMEMAERMVKGLSGEQDA